MPKNSVLLLTLFICYFSQEGKCSCFVLFCLFVCIVRKTLSEQTARAFLAGMRESLLRERRCASWRVVSPEVKK